MIGAKWTVFLLIALVYILCLFSGGYVCADKIADPTKGADQIQLEQKAREEKQAKGKTIPPGLTLPEDTNPKFSVKEVQISGNSLLSTEELLEDVPAIFDNSALREVDAESAELYDFGDLLEVLRTPGTARQISSRTIQGFTQYLLSVYQKEICGGIYVYIPSDVLEKGAKLSGGVLPVQVIEGRVSDVSTAAFTPENQPADVDSETPDWMTERAWVLEDPPLVEAAPLAKLELPELKGCPVELEAAAEVGLGPEELQLLVGNSLAANPNIQPCDACARLVGAAKVLQDVDGAYMAAMNEVFNAVAPVNMPFTPETETLIVTAFSRLSDEQPQYATAMEYIDAFVNYIAVLDTELGSPVEDSAAYVLAKYGSPVTDNPNGNMAAYVMSRIEGIGG